MLVVCREQCEFPLFHPKWGIGFRPVAATMLSCGSHSGWGGLNQRFPGESRSSSKREGEHATAVIEGKERRVEI